MFMNIYCKLSKVQSETKAGKEQKQLSFHQVKQHKTLLFPNRLPQGHRKRNK